jgi:uncharacterized protein YndB with AHSA1/START domain
VSDPLVITRAFRASRQQVWEAWTRPDEFARWFGTEVVEVPPAAVSLDVRPGGVWSAQMHLTGEETVHWFGRYIQVDPPHRLAFTMNDDADAPPYPEPVVVQLEEVDRGTEMTLTQPRGDFTDEEMEHMEASYHAFFDAMGRLLVDRATGGTA